jgi:hypothetical protein
MRHLAERFLEILDFGLKIFDLPRVPIPASVCVCVYVCMYIYIYIYIYTYITLHI